MFCWLRCTLDMVWNGGGGEKHYLRCTKFQIRLDLCLDHLCTRMKVEPIVLSGVCICREHFFFYFCAQDVSWHQPSGNGCVTFSQ